MNKSNDTWLQNIVSYVLANHWTHCPNEWHIKWDANKRWLDHIKGDNLMPWLWSLVYKNVCIYGSIEHKMRKTQKKIHKNK